MNQEKSSKKCEKGKDPKTCSAEQIRECHGEASEHPCESEKEN
jgi:hypothetical protein